ncbi:Dyp-type peroxidase [Dermatophilus congolensis]|uniref:Dyp-type peroxidase n=1 Tax=Dermatophilus congolensis TaxID=1863 RepID=UPI001AAFD056|nr:Dyp-type peroxidase [Dermatophilus congolensis]MBO3151252.1 Dyp-type peroxidase [Dermatophilus congolensis]MBO3161744.1 Dyp-type peroxidase [Dermatophilus congolensis]MBO3162538.1 Dyp-type peroxidase [Dermatophilus congolensis]MBO3176091.1 Dyp-type peroxidase [Dermatophilus congolensis]
MTDEEFGVIPSRRSFLSTGAIAGWGAATAFGLAGLARAEAGGQRADSRPDQATPATDTPHGGDTIAFYGEHQPGVDTPAQAHANFVALELDDDIDKEGLRRLMRILTDDAARLMAGRGALADSEPELAAFPSRLSVTFGFGPEFVRRAGGQGPGWLRPLPKFKVDRLEPEWSGGDLFLMIGSDDPTALSHATRMLLKDTRSFATVKWIQPGFRHARDTLAPGTTMRNLFGQVDGTVNASAGTPEFARQVWIPTGPFAGGTGVVIRRIRMDLDTWDEVDPAAREHSIGRRIDNGAPLTGKHEQDEPDFSAVTESGFPVISQFAHMRRARSGDPRHKIVRRGYSYEVPVLAGQKDASGIGTDAGLIFVAYAADVDAQFVPIQRRLDEADLLNTWTTPIGSAVFVIPPGCKKGGYIGETLLE